MVAVEYLASLRMHAMGCQEYVKTMAQGPVVLGMEIDGLVCVEEYGKNCGAQFVRKVEKAKVVDWLVLLHR